MNYGQVKTVLIFVLRFSIIAPGVLVLWWLLVPAYVWALGQVSGGIINSIVDAPLEAMKVISDGILNTHTSLVYFVEGRERTIEIAFIVNNVPSFVTLVLATAGLGFRKRLGILAIGMAILIADHFLFLVSSYVFRAQIAESPEVFVAFGKFSLTLPFVLWIVLAYWEGILALFSEGNATRQRAEKAEN